MGWPVGSVSKGGGFIAHRFTHRNSLQSKETGDFSPGLS
jgi:hypothetical protein